jgi:hypothetical protein
VEKVLPHLARFVGTTVVDRPWAYAVPPEVGALLARHGLKTRVLSRATPASVEQAVLEEVRQADGRAILEAKGEVLIKARHERESQTLPAGMWLVETEQRLGAIAVYLCEAESDDGLVAGELIPVPKPGERFPALRVLEPCGG